MACGLLVLIAPPTVAFESTAVKGDPMLRWAIAFFLVAILAAALGFGGIAGDAAVLAKICFLIFLVLAVLSLFFGRGRLA
jgi:uncharacterized membrane protein YtjA (UPF0391 family)